MKLQLRFSVYQINLLKYVMYSKHFEYKIPFERDLNQITKGLIRKINHHKIFTQQMQVYLQEKRSI